MRVLIHEWVTGGGRAGGALPAGLAREGAAMRRALVDDFRALPGVAVVTTLDPRFLEGPGRPDVVAVAAGRESEIVGRLASECDYTVVVAPETGGVLEHLARLVEESGGRSLGSTPRAIALAADKRACARHLERAGVPTPESEPFDPRGGLAPSFGFPAVIKPVDGAGAVDTWLVTEPNAMPRLEANPGGYLAQPYCPGRALSLSAIVGPDGRVRPLGVGEQVLSVERGRFVYQGGRLPEPGPVGEEPAIEALRSLPGLRGFVGVDFVHDPRTGRASVIEINPRVTTSFVGWQRWLGVGRIAEAWLGPFEGRRPTSEPGRSGTPIRFFPDGRIESDAGGSS